MSSEPAHGLLNFDIDRYINPWIPHNRLYLFPKPVSRFLGYRAEPHKEPAAALQWPVTFLATVAGLCLVAGIDNYTPGVSQIHPPILIASLGASAVLDFNTVRSPLAQPRNSVIGNTLAAICGVAIAKLFQLNSDFQNILWLSAAFGCGLASLIMSITNTVHPPGGATAVLASIDAQVVAMGWNFVPLVLLDSVLMTIVALIFNNVFRQYPTHWWSASPVGHQLRKKEGEEKAVEEGAATKTILSDSSSGDIDSVNFDDEKEGFETIAKPQILLHHVRIPSHGSFSEEVASSLQEVQQVNDTTNSSGGVVYSARK